MAKKTLKTSIKSTLPTRTAFLSNVLNIFYAINLYDMPLKFIKALHNLKFMYFVFKICHAINFYRMP